MNHQSKWKAKTIKLTEENIEKYGYDLVIGKDLKRTQRNTNSKIMNELNIIKNFSSQKRLVRE